MVFSQLLLEEMLKVYSLFVLVDFNFSGSAVFGRSFVLAKFIKELF